MWWPATTMTMPRVLEPSHYLGMRSILCSAYAGLLIREHEIQKGNMETFIGKHHFWVLSESSTLGFGAELQSLNLPLDSFLWHNLL